MAENCVHKLPAIRQANCHKISLVCHIISYTSNKDGQHQSRVTQSHQIQSHRVIWSLGCVQPDKSYPKMHHISPSAALARSRLTDRQQRSAAGGPALSSRPEIICSLCQMRSLSLHCRIGAWTCIVGFGLFIRNDSNIAQTVSSARI